jgi:hypothetical protein
MKVAFAGMIWLRSSLVILSSPQPYLLLFIQQAKTDTYPQGQWVSIASSSDPFLACQLLHCILHYLTRLWACASLDSKLSILAHLSRQRDSLPISPATLLLLLQDIPLIFAVHSHTELPVFSKVVSYPQFLGKVKAWGADIGLDPRDLGTHSLRRGLASDWALQGVPDRLRREHGRWRSAKVADGYIDTSINIQLLLHAQKK